MPLTVTSPTKHFGSAIFLLVSLTLTTVISGCSSSSSSEPAFKSRTANLTGSNQLTEQEVLDIDPLVEITEDDIQQAIRDANKDALRVAHNARIVLVQSGATIPDATMQQEMMKYYNVSVYSGLSPTKPRPSMAKKAEEQEVAPQPNYIKSLRLASAKARQDKIIVYWGSFELGLPDKDNTKIVWIPYANDSVSEKTKKLRYSIRFAVVDVKTGMWAMYTPPNTEGEFINLVLQPNQDKLKQIIKVKEDAYTTTAKNFAEHFEKIVDSSARNQ